MPHRHSGIQYLPHLDVEEHREPRAKPPQTDSYRIASQAVALFVPSGATSGSLWTRSWQLYLIHWSSFGFSGCYCCVAAVDVAVRCCRCGCLWLVTVAAAAVVAVVAAVVAVAAMAAEAALAAGCCVIVAGCNCVAAVAAAACC